MKKQLAEAEVDKAILNEALEGNYRSWHDVSSQQAIEQFHENKRSTSNHHKAV